MRHFLKELEARAPRVGAAKPRRWVYVPYDQLSADLGPLKSTPASELGVVLIESPAKAARRPYHKQKLALVLTSQRHFALELVERGVAVRYEVSPAGYAEALAPLARELGPLTMMEAAERELRSELAPLIETGQVVVTPHDGWLTTARDFAEGAGPRPPWRMDAFYRHVRARTGILMDGAKPEGGKLSFDVENRRAWKGEPAAPEAPTFGVDEVTAEVVELIERRYGTHPGALDASRIPARSADVESMWQWALTAAIPHFGPFEDAMSVRSSGLFHTKIANLLNLHRLLPARVVRDVAARIDVPLASREGFVRQVLGWREFVRHVHVATDGFRAIPGAATGDPTESAARPSTLGAHEPLPAAFWGKASGLGCLDHVVADVWREGYSHHITRLMILSNLATLLAIEPRELTDWFWAAYTDAFDWVVEPNVLGMGTYAVGDTFTTKPYVSGAAYIDKMSDFCDGCAFDPSKDCPVTRLYWAFLARHADRFGKNPRLAGPIANVKRRAMAEREEDVRTFEAVLGSLRRAELLTPASLRRR